MTGRYFPKNLYLVHNWKLYERRGQMSCIFCEIIQKKRPAKIIYEDEFSVAFEDVNPQAPVHTLVIPKKHISTNLDMEERDKFLVGHLFMIANGIAKGKGIAERGFRLVMNCNPESGQTVFHMHLHMLGGRYMHWPPG
jgi:histidine triad (HIT) family protein